MFSTEIAAVFAIRRPLLAAFAVLAASMPFIAVAQTVGMRPVQHLDLVDVGEVEGLAVQPDGGVVLAGEFTRIMGQPRRTLARITPDGALDPQWVSNTWLYGSILDRAHLTAVADGAVIVYGVNVVTDSMSRSVARLRADGTVDTGWQGPGNCGHGSEYVFASDGWLYYYDFCQSAVRRVVSDGNGAVDPGWNVPLGVVDRLAVGAGGVLYAYARAGTLLKIDIAGAAIDTQWQPGYSGSPATAVVADADSVYVADGSSRVFKYWSTGAGAAAPNWPTNPAVPERSSSLALDGAGSLFVGGSDDNGTGIVLARLSATDGQPIDTHESVGTSNVGVLRTVGAGRVVAGGTFSNIAGVTRLGLARFDSGAVGAALDAEKPPIVANIAAQPDGALILSGRFARALGLERRQLLRMTKDGNLDMEWNPRVAGDIALVLPDGNGDVFVAGEFHSIGGTTRPLLAKLHGASGSVETSWNPPVDREPLALAADNAGRLYVAAPTVARAFQIVRTSRSGDGSFDAEWQTDGSVRVDGAMLALSGYLYAQLGHGRLQRFSLIDGSIDSNWDVAISGDIRSIRPGAGQSLIIGGLFDWVGGAQRGGVARVFTDRVPSLDTQWDAQVSGWGIRTATSDDGDVFVTGDFSTLAGQPRNGSGKLSSATCALLDWTIRPGGGLSAIGADQIWIVQADNSAVNISRYPLETGDVVFRSRWELD